MIYPGQRHSSFAMHPSRLLFRRSNMYPNRMTLLGPEMQKAVRRYQITNGLRATGYLDAHTLAVMGLQEGRVTNCETLRPRARRD